MTPLIWMLGDNHGNFDHIMETIERTEETPAAVIFLGDLECQTPFSDCICDLENHGIPAYFIPGNHDTDSAENYLNLWGDKLFHERNLHGKVTEIAGFKVAGLGGVFRGDVWCPPEKPSYRDYAEFEKMNRSGRTRLSKHDLKGLPTERSGAEMQKMVREGRKRKHRSSIFFADYERLWGQHADILVTHEAPSCHRHGFEAIDALARSMGVKTTFHGHHHEHRNYAEHAAKLGFKAFGVGFYGITDATGRIVRPGDRDEASKYRASHPEENQ